jgi:hypothetical protein
VRALPARFTDDFNRELAGTRLDHWESLGAVSVIGTTSYGNRVSALVLDNASFLRQCGMAVALGGVNDGHRIPGRIRTADTFRFLQGVRYKLDFELAGGHRACSSGAIARSIVTSIPGVGATMRTHLPQGARFRPVSLFFTPEATRNSKVEFASGDASGRGGLLLKNVRFDVAA